MKKQATVLAAGIFLFMAGAAMANVGEIKIYKEAFPEAKPKCQFCHVDALPKKDDGRHELNAYGKKIKEVSATPTAETYTTVGEFEKFDSSSTK